MHFRCLFAVLPVTNVDRGVADDAEHFALVTEEGEPPPAGVRPVRTADAVDMEKTVVGDVFYNKPDLVGMGFDHDSRGVGIFPFDRCPGIAIGITLDRVSKLAASFRPDPLPPNFEAGWAGGVEEFVEKGFGGGVHGGGRD